MPRLPRQKSQTGIYHLIVRRANRCVLFHEDEDYYRYLRTLAQVVEESAGTVLGYCLMTNHVHLLIQEDKISISNIMHRLGSSYAYYYNKKYGHCGHVFQNRFKSEAVEDDNYLKTVIRYIHQNPVKAGLSSRAETYPWSSYQVYYEGKEPLPGLTNTDLILGLFDDNPEQAIESFYQFAKMDTSDVCLDYSDNESLTDAQAQQIIEEILLGASSMNLHRMKKSDRDAILHQLKTIDGLSIRQIARLTGIGFNIVKRA